MAPRVPGNNTRFRWPGATNPHLSVALHMDGEISGLLLDSRLEKRIIQEEFWAQTVWPEGEKPLAEIIDPSDPVSSAPATAGPPASPAPPVPPPNDSIPIKALIDASLAVEISWEALPCVCPDAIRAVALRGARFFLIGGRFLSVSPQGCELLCQDQDWPIWSAVGPQHLSGE